MVVGGYEQVWEARRAGGGRTAKCPQVPEMHLLRRVNHVAPVIPLLAHDPAERNLPQLVLLHQRLLQSNEVLLACSCRLRCKDGIGQVGPIHRPIDTPDLGGQVFASPICPPELVVLHVPNQEEVQELEVPVLDLVGLRELGDPAIFVTCL